MFDIYAFGKFLLFKNVFIKYIGFIINYFEINKV